MTDARLERAHNLRALAEAAKRYADAITSSARAAEARAALGPHATRAKMTSANARWARCADHRDRLEEEFQAALDLLGVSAHPNSSATLTSSQPAAVKDSLTDQQAALPPSVFQLARKRIDNGAAQHGQQWAQGGRTAINFIEHRVARGAVAPSEEHAHE